MLAGQHWAWQALKSTIKTALFVAVLEFVVRKAYFIDLSQPLGVSSLFLFIVSFFLMQDSGPKCARAAGRGS